MSTSLGLVCLLDYDNHWVSFDSWEARMVPWRELWSVCVSGATVITFRLERPIPRLKYNKIKQNKIKFV